jgi:hypothetical protein
LALFPRQSRSGHPTIQSADRNSSKTINNLFFSYEETSVKRPWRSRARFGDGKLIASLALATMAMLALTSAALAQDSAQHTTQPVAQVPNAPFNFSHKKHADIKQCEFCHETATTGSKASFPVEGKCMVCHAVIKRDSDAIKQLAAIPKDAHITPEKPLYKLPEFVYFSHARHSSANIGCEQCHGMVFERDAVELHMPMRMKACVDCHRAIAAAVTCTSCHESMQQQ